MSSNILLKDSKAFLTGHNFTSGRKNVKPTDMEKIKSSPKIGYMPILIMVLLLDACSIYQPQILSKIRTFPTYPIQPAPDSILLVNTYDIRAENLRDNKEKLFIELIDSTHLELSRNIGHRTPVPTYIAYGLSKPGPAGDLRPLLMEYHASHAIAVTYFDVSFVQEDLVVTEDEYGKSKEAYYDIVSEINYSL
jgi:hypothetical protein